MINMSYFKLIVIVMCSKLLTDNCQTCRYKVVKAGVGRNHTVVVTDDGKSFSFGHNKNGQLGTGSLRNGWFLLLVSVYG
jgi:alpha-tubulin suppressor-like RCC1 family protein